ncbi:MAG: OsmC family protein [Gemmatimonadetes bacterium]|nr:OsmC family protein [Gemmatimonadota bacterium]
MTGTFAGALGAREITIQPEDLVAEVVGEVEKDGGVLVIRRIHVKYKLHVPDPDEVRDTVARVLDMHVDKCPVALSIKGAIEVTTDVEFV